MRDSIVPQFLWTDGHSQANDPSSRSIVAIGDMNDPQRPSICQTMVFTHVFAPEAERRLDMDELPRIGFDLHPGGVIGD